MTKGKRRGIAEIVKLIRSGEIRLLLTPPRPKLPSEMTVRERIEYLRTQKVAVLVVAGTHEHFRRFCQRYLVSPNLVRFISRPDQLRGYDRVEFVLTNGYQTNDAYRSDVYDIVVAKSKRARRLAGEVGEDQEVESELFY